MRKRVAGGAVLAAVIAGIWLGTQWKGPGLGGGSGLMNPGTENVHVSVPSSPSTSSSSDNNTVPPAGQPSGGVAQNQPLTVVIIGNGFRLTNESDPASGVDATLEDVIQNARNQALNPDGIRIRILYSRTAQEGARADLMSALSEAGIKPEEIQERSDFVD